MKGKKIEQLKNGRLFNMKGERKCRKPVGHSYFGCKTKKKCVRMVDY